MTAAIQETEVYHDWNRARADLDGLSAQEGYLGGRLVEREGSVLLQAFFADAPHTVEWLPDGCRRVLIPASMGYLVPGAGSESAALDGGD
jgi:hypothetical protein